MPQFWTWVITWNLCRKPTLPQLRPSGHDEQKIEKEREVKVVAFPAKAAARPACGGKSEARGPKSEGRWRADG